MIKSLDYTAEKLKAMILDLVSLILTAGKK